MIHITKKDRKELHAKKNVIGVGEGTKHCNGIDTGEKCAVVFVGKKKPLSAIHSGDRIPKTVGGKFRKIKTDVIECGEIKPLSVKNPHQEKHRPLVGGVSCAPKGFGLSGTIGLPLIYQKNEPMFLSNVHVIAPHWDNKRLSDDEIEEYGIHIGTKILQPSTMDMKGNKDTIGILWDWKDLKIDEDNFFDAAIGKLDTKAIPELLGLGKYTKTGEPKNGMVVRKSGRTSKVTESKVTVTNFTVRILYNGLGEANFIEQIGMMPALMSPGDSGSVIVDQHNTVIALAFAGSDLFSVATPINKIFKYFDLRMTKKGDNEKMKTNVDKELKQFSKLHQIIDAAFHIAKVIIQTIGKLTKKNKE